MDVFEYGFTIQELSHWQPFCREFGGGEVCLLGYSFPPILGSALTGGGVMLWPSSNRSPRMDLLRVGWKYVTVEHYAYLSSFTNVDVPHVLYVHGGPFALPGTIDVVSNFLAA